MITVAGLENSREGESAAARTLQNVNHRHDEGFGGPGRDRTDDLFHPFSPYEEIQQFTAPRDHR